MFGKFVFAFPEFWIIDKYLANWAENVVTSKFVFLLPNTDLDRV